MPSTETCTPHGGKGPASTSGTLWRPLLRTGRYRYRCSGHSARLVRGEEYDDRGDLLPRRPTRGIALRHRAAILGRVNDPRQHDVGCDPLALRLLREGFSPADERGVGHRVPRRALLTLERRHRRA